jgi:hypothetical protein
LASATQLTPGAVRELWRAGGGYGRGLGTVVTTQADNGGNHDRDDEGHAEAGDGKDRPTHAPILAPRCNGCETVPARLAGASLVVCAQPRE